MLHRLNSITVIAVCAAISLCGCDKETVVQELEPDVSLDDLDGDVDGGRIDSSDIGREFDADAQRDTRAEPDPFAALNGEVTLIRDTDGIMHVFAADTHDLFFANGYVVARDRFAQLEFYRRISTGTLSEVVGVLSSDAIDVDVLFRTLGLKRNAQIYWDEQVPADAESRRIVEAYTAGINAYLAEYRAGTQTQPTVIQNAFSPENTRDWEPSDTAAIGKLLALSLTYAADTYIDAHAFRQEVLDTFDPASMDTALAKRAGLFGDLVRNDPVTPVTHIDGFPTSGMALRELPRAPRVNPALLRSARDLHRTFRGHPLFERMNPLASSERYGRGSNNWVLAGALTESGFPNVANDPHLDLSTPTVFYPLHLHQTEGEDPYRMIGAAYVGAPGVVIGRTEHVAWGSTVGFYDYVDVYHEQVTGSSDGVSTVSFDGQQVEIERLTETIRVGTLGTISDEFDLTVEWVPHHGPIIPQISDGRPLVRESGEALSVRWVGQEPSNEVEFLAGVWRAKTPEDAEIALDHYEVGSSNFVFGFTSGDIFYSGQSKIPVRDAAALTYHPVDNPTGNIPWMILPGDGTAEWTGFIPEEKIPHALNPAKNFIITANNDQVGVTLDNDTANDEYYLAGFFASGVRAERIEERITNLTGERGDDEPITVDMQVDIQNDGWDKMASRLAPHFVSAADTVLDPNIADSAFADLGTLRAEIAGSEASLAQMRDLLAAWDYSAPRSRAPSGDEASASAAETLFSVAMVFALRNAYGDELTLVGRYDGGSWDVPSFGEIVPRSFIWLLENPDAAQTYDPGAQDVAIFDDLATPTTETRLTVLVRALMQARDRLGAPQPFGSRLSRDIPSPRSTDPADWVWGNLHGLALNGLLPITGVDWQRPSDGLPFFERQGGQLAVTPCNHGYNDFDFICTSGSSLRMVHDMDPGGPRTWNAVPGGTVADPASPYFDNQMAPWQAGTPMLMRWERADVEAAAVSTETLSRSTGAD